LSTLNQLNNIKYILWEEKMNVKPLGNRVLVQLIQEEQKEQKTAGGIYLPEEATKNDTFRKGKVVTVGDVKEVQSGDTVLLENYGGTELDIDGTTHLIVTEKDILGKVEE